MEEKIQIDSDDYNNESSIHCILAESVKNVRRITISNINMINSIYTITNNNNKLYTAFGAEEFTTTLTNGYYDIISLLSHVQSRLTSVCGRTFYVSLNQITNKVSIQCINGPFNLLFNNKPETAYRRLGFDKNTDYTGESTYTAPNIFVITPRYIYINSRDLTRNTLRSENIRSNKNITYNKSYVIMQCPIRENFGGYISYEESFKKTLYYSTPQDIAEFDLFITDEYGKPVSFNGVPFTIELTASKQK